MKQLFKFGVILGVICLTATLVLAVTYQVTRPKIEGELSQEEQNALKVIFPAADSFTRKTMGEMEYFEALKNNTAAGYCLKITANGYNGFISVMAGIDPSGVITGVSILSHQETPGLGAKINEIKPGENDQWFLRQFKGKRAGKLEVKKDIDAVTGATISSAAVTTAINNAVNAFFKEVKNKK
ncbi:MAG: RnfABCDGE type electron transport complex subunit G [Candidatus Omnitrophica bacterium]|nr:RnfABCDGE type electron transport complex subunit G [Candidatus Omnitrophota bacterium]